MREESNGQEDNLVEKKSITQRQSEDVFPVSCRRSSLGPGSLADAIKQNGSALGRTLRKWGESTFNPPPRATGCAKKKTLKRSQMSSAAVHPDFLQVPKDTCYSQPSLSLPASDEGDCSRGGVV